MCVGVCLFLFFYLFQGVIDGMVVALLRHKLFRSFHFCSDDVLHDLLKEVSACIMLYFFHISYIFFTGLC